MFGINRVRAISASILLPTASPTQADSRAADAFLEALAGPGCCR